MVRDAIYEETLRQKGANQRHLFAGFWTAVDWQSRKDIVRLAIAFSGVAFLAVSAVIAAYAAIPQLRVVDFTPVSYLLGVIIAGTLGTMAASLTAGKSPRGAAPEVKSALLRTIRRQ